MKKKILIIIDAQYDFINGTLSVNGAQVKMEALADFILSHYGDYDLIVLSADFHPITHCSFEKNGGTWPIHCVQHSHGASIFQPIMDAIEKTGIDFCVLTKGVDEDHEEYSVLKNSESNKKLSAIIDSHKIECADFAGIADVFCVKDSISDFHRTFPNVKVGVFPDFVGNMNEKEFYDFLYKNEFIEIKK